MKRKKFFGIGAVVLMLLVGIGSAVNGMSINDRDDGIELNISNDGPDVKVVVEDCHFIGLDETGDNVIYQISYYYENVGSGDYPQASLREHIMYNKEHEIKKWERPVMTVRSKARTPTITEKVTIPADKEELLAGRKFYLKVLFDDGNPENDKDLGFGAFGWEGSDYTPTYAQIRSTMERLGHAIKNYEPKKLGGLFTPLTDRLGWVYELYNKITIVIEKGLKLDYEALLVGVAVTAEIYIILDWLVKFDAFCAAPNPLTLDIMIADTAKALAALIVIYETLVMHHGIEKLIVAWEEFSNAVNNTAEYIKSRPWYNQIRLIHGDLKGKGLGSKTVTVRCRGFEQKRTGDYYFKDLDPEAMGEKAWQIHDCTVTASANKFKTKKSPAIASWAFSDGTMRYDFYLMPDKSRSLTRSRFVNTILERWLSFIKPSSLYLLEI